MVTITLGVTPTLALAFDINSKKLQDSRDALLENIAAVATVANAAGGNPLKPETVIASERALSNYYGTVISTCDRQTVALSNLVASEAQHAQGWGLAGGVTGAAAAVATYHPVASFLAAITGLFSVGQNSLANAFSANATTDAATLSTLDAAITKKLTDYHTLNVSIGNTSAPLDPTNGYYIVLGKRRDALQQVTEACVFYSNAKQNTIPAASK